MDSPIGDLNHPPRQVPLQLLEGGGCSPGQGIVFDVSDAAFDLPLSTSTAGSTGLRCQSSIPAESLEARIPDYLAGLTIVRGDQRRGVVAEDLLGESAEVSEGSIDSLSQSSCR